MVPVYAPQYFSRVAPCVVYGAIIPKVSAQSHSLCTSQTVAKTAANVSKNATIPTVNPLADACIYVPKTAFRLQDVKLPQKP